MQQTQSGIATDASSITTQINQLTQSIASLNEQITAVQSASDSTPNGLIDTRQADLNTLSGLVNVTATTQSNGSVTVALADNPAVVLVDGNDSNGAGTTQSLSVAYNPNATVPLTVSASTTGSLGTGVPSGGRFHSVRTSTWPTMSSARPVLRRQHRTSRLTGSTSPVKLSPWSTPKTRPANGASRPPKGLAG